MRTRIRRLTLTLLVAALGLVSVLVPVNALAAFKSIEGAGYGVLLDERNRCVLAWSDAALPSTIACQEKALLWRTDEQKWYTSVAGTWTTAAMEIGALTVGTSTTFPSGDIASADIALNTIVADDIATSGVATAEILNGTILNEDVSTSAAIARSKLAEDALQIYGIPISAIRSDAGAALTAAETAGTFDVTYGTNTILANGEVTDNETETSVAWFQFTLPAEYVAAGDVTIRLPCAIISTATAVNNGSTLDVAVFEQADAGTVGSDLSTTTAAATFAALDTWYTKDFVITATGLVAGDVLNIKITSTMIDSEAGAGTMILNLAPPKVLLDIQG